MQLLFSYNSVHVLVYRDHFQVQISLASLQISLEQVSPTSALQFCNVYKYTDIFINRFVSKSYFELEFEKLDSIGTKIQLNPINYVLVIEVTAACDRGCTASVGLH